MEYSATISAEEYRALITKVTSLDIANANLIAEANNDADTICKLGTDVENRDEELKHMKEELNGAKNDVEYYKNLWWATVNERDEAKKKNELYADFLDSTELTGGFNAWAQAHKEA